MAAATQKIIIHADDKTGAAIASAIRNTKKLDNQIARTGDAMRTSTRQSRAHMAQLGHQVQDVAVQFQMGMNPLMILGQQGSQVASIFGTKGALFGGFLAVAAVVGSSLAPSLFEASRAAGEFHDEIIQAAGGIDKLTEAQRRLAQLDLQLRINEQQQALDDALKKIEEYNQNIADAIKLHQENPFGFLEDVDTSSDEELNKMNQALELAKARLAATQEQMARLTAATEDATEATKKFNREQERVAKQMAERMKLIFDSASAEEKFQLGVDKLRRSLENQNGELTPDALEAYRVGVEKLAAKLFPAKNIVDETKKAIKEKNEVVKEYGLTLMDVEKRAVGSLEDGLVGLISGTKSASAAFKDMARSIVSDLIRMQIQQSITAPLFGAINSGGLNFGTAMRYGTNVGSQQTSMIAAQNAGLRANGGPVSRNKPYIVGERGPELMIPRGGGTVMPNEDLGGGGTVNVTLNISTGVSQTVRAEIANLLPQITQATKSAVADARMRGGSFSGAMGV